MTNTVLKAAEFAREKHKGQLDDNGESYFSAHLYKVALTVAAFTKDAEVIAAAYLHDVLEDTDTTYTELKDEFGERIAGLVYEVTQEGEKDEYGYYFPRLKSKDAILIKFADRMSNLSRMQSWDEKRKSKYLKRSQFWKDGSDLPKKK